MMRAVTCRVKGKCAGMRRCVRSSVESATMVHARVPRPDRQLDAMNYSKRVRSQRLYLLALSQWDCEQGTEQKVTRQRIVKLADEQSSSVSGGLEF
jgi:hypothetical protein